jgi:hypothetical protein
MRRYNGIILWKIKEEKAMMIENSAHIMRGSLDAVDYHQLVTTLFNDTFEKNTEIYN